MMGAASKGIIQRGFQHNATVYKAPYAKNPFDNVTDDELNEYKRTVERKKKSVHGECKLAKTNDIWGSHYYNIFEYICLQIPTQTFRNQKLSCRRGQRNTLKVNQRPVCPLFQTIPKS